MDLVAIDVFGDVLSTLTELPRYTLDLELSPLIIPRTTNRQQNRQFQTLSEENRTTLRLTKKLLETTKQYRLDVLIKTYSVLERYFRNLSSGSFILLFYILI